MARVNTAALMGAATKVCCQCGINVAGRLRTKDSFGNYYCASCFLAKHDQELREFLAAQMPEPELWRKVPLEAYAVYT
ncbi:MAG: hypothetical protein ACP5QA_02370 [Phycisphaerae bacterium]